MTRLIGADARVGERIVTPEIGKDHPAHRTKKVYLGGNSADATDVLEMKNAGGVKTHRMLQSGVTYFQAIEPIVATSKIGAGLPFDDIRTKKLTWDDGTFQTTAAAGGATPGLSMVGVNTIPAGPALDSGDIVVAGALGEVGRWKIVVPNLVSDGAVGWNFWMTRAGGAQLAGGCSGIEYDSSPPGFITPFNVTFPTAPIPITLDPVAIGQHSQLEIDVTQKAGDYGSVAIRYCYFSASGRFRTTTRNFQSIPPNDMAGFYIRPAAGANLQGTVYVYKYSS